VKSLPKTWSSLPNKPLSPLDIIALKASKHVAGDRLPRAALPLLIATFQVPGKHVEDPGKLGAVAPGAWFLQRPLGDEGGAVEGKLPSQVLET